MFCNAQNNGQIFAGHERYLKDILTNAIFLKDKTIFYIGQVLVLVDHCPLTGTYFEPWNVQKSSTFIHT